MSDKTSPITNLPQEPSAERLYSITLQHWTVPTGESINMYCITKATFTVVQKQSQQCNTRHLSAEAFTILE